MREPIPLPRDVGGVDLGTAIQAARVSRGWSQRRLALAIPVDETHLGRWERGERPVPLAQIARIARILRTPWLLRVACAACPVAQRGDDPQEVRSAWSC